MSERKNAIPLPPPAGKKKPARRQVISMSWKLKDDLDMNARYGVYFLGTSLRDVKQTTYNTFTGRVGE